jgi:lipoprotein-releasing system permease protein
VKFPFFIARRYLFAKKSTNIINLISGISMVVVAGVSGAMIVVLSAFNGIEGLVQNLYSSFDADITVMPYEGQTLSTDSISIEAIEKVDGVLKAHAFIEQVAGVSSEGGDRNIVILIRGVGEDYLEIANLQPKIRDGEFKVTNDGPDFAVIAYGVKTQLAIPDVSGRDVEIVGYPLLNMKAPIRGKTLQKFKDKAFEQKEIMVSGMYSINAELDEKYIVVPISYAKELFHFENEISGFDVKIDPEKDPEKIKADIMAITGNLSAQTRAERNSLIYQTNESEKWATFLIMLFILFIAAFNIVASLTMLIIEKKKDLFILRSMGLPNIGINRIFVIEGVLIYCLGAVIGLSFGIGLCYAQQHFGLVRLHGSIQPFYPVQVLWGDVLMVIVSVMVVGALFSGSLVKYLVKRFALS